MNAIIMTVKGRKDLTEQCLQSMGKTIQAGDLYCLIVVDAAIGFDAMWPQDVETFADGPMVQMYYLSRPNCSISQGWNIGITKLMELSSNDADMDVWLLNNDVVFKRSGWIKLLSERLRVSGTGIVGSSAMSVFGHPFATGGIWGFNLATALSIAEDGKILDELLNYCCQDVDLSIRMSKAGYTVTHVPDVELGADPMMVHLVSQTVYTNEAESVVLEKRKPEFERLIQKHGRRE